MFCPTLHREPELKQPAASQYKPVAQFFSAGLHMTAAVIPAGVQRKSDGNPGNAPLMQLAPLAHVPKGSHGSGEQIAPTGWGTAQRLTHTLIAGDTHNVTPVTGLHG